MLPSILGEIDTDRRILGRLHERASRTARAGAPDAGTGVDRRAGRSAPSSPTRRRSLVADTRVLDAGRGQRGPRRARCRSTCSARSLAIEADTVTPAAPVPALGPGGSRRRSWPSTASPPASRCARSSSAPASSRISTRSRSRSRRPPTTPPTTARSATGSGPNATSLRPRRARSRPSCAASSTTRSGRPIPPSIASCRHRAPRGGVVLRPRRAPARRSVGERDPQLEVSLERDATVSPVEAKTLPLAPGEAPAPGQYVVHGVDELRLPYLPDVAAGDLARVPGGRPGPGHRVPVRRRGLHRALRRRVAGAAAVPARARRGGRARRAGSTATCSGSTCQPGTSSGSVSPPRSTAGDLRLFGLWRSLPRDHPPNDPDIAEAVADGWLWAFTPYDDVTLVHAVPRPLEAPRPTRCSAPRPAEGSVEVVLARCRRRPRPQHRSRSPLEARWTDSVDDLSLPGPEDRERAGGRLHDPDPRVRGSRPALRHTLDLPDGRCPTVGPVRFHKAAPSLSATPSTA